MPPLGCASNSLLAIKPIARITSQQDSGRNALSRQERKETIL